jgi:predicted lipid-binding transport protein (Tim44 family)
MFRSRWFRLSALFAVLLTVFSLSAVTTAEARFGGSFGSRGTRTYQTVPSTPTVPMTTGPVQRSMNTPSYGNTGGFNQGYRPGGFFSGLGGWMLGGLLFSGLFGMMFGGGLGGFGGFGGIFSLLIQVAILFFVLRWVFRRFGWGQQQAASGPTYGGGNSYNYSAPRQDWQPSGNGYGSGYGGNADSGRGGKDEIGVSNADLNTFEQRLGQLQDAYSREDYDGLRRIVTPEVMSYLSEELAQNAAKGLRNEVFDVKLLSGDIAESWREGSDEYVTVALRYESRDVMRNRTTGELVSGVDGIDQHSEVWTFVRHNRGEWLLSAIQGA